jgi:hypothetical protein
VLCPGIGKPHDARAGIHRKTPELPWFPLAVSEIAVARRILPERPRPVAQRARCAREAEPRALGIGAAELGGGRRARTVVASVANSLSSEHLAARSSRIHDDMPALV